MKIAVIGAGIYGCHIALSIKSKYNNVDLYDIADDIFSGASTLNSHRIHKGYHYPRSGKTRSYCLEDEVKFTQHYSSIVSSSNINPKLFCVADDDKTKIDYETMKIIISGSNLPFKELSSRDLNNFGLSNIEGGFKVYESVLLVDKAKSFFKDSLGRHGINLKLNSYVKDVSIAENDKLIINRASEQYDFVINCTYNQALSYSPNKHKHYFDLCFYLIVALKNKDKRFYSFGIFDGAYPSLEPFGYGSTPEEYRGYKDSQLFQIFHVNYTSIRQYTDIYSARDAFNTKLSSDEINRYSQRIIDDVLKFYPSFHDDFEIIDYKLALKTKVRDLSDSRPLIVVADNKLNNRFIHVFSSKLTSIFRAEDQVKQLIYENTSNNHYQTNNALPCASGL